MKSIKRYHKKSVKVECTIPPTISPKQLSQLMFKRYRAAETAIREYMSNGRLRTRRSGMQKE